MLKGAHLPRPFRLVAPALAGLALTATLARPASPQAPPASAAAPVPPPTQAEPAAVPAASPAAAPVGAAPAPATAALVAPSFPIEEYTLFNGLRVILAPDMSLPNVAVQVGYDVGSRDEPDGLSGIAHLVEHLMFERSSHVPRGATLRLLANAGASELNGMTTFDRTYYFEEVPAERLELALWLESDRMGFFLPAIDEQAVEQERTVVWNELRMKHLDRPGGIGPLEVWSATFPSWHPYHATPAGNEEDIRRITLADVKAFAGTWCGPGNATLVLAGRFERDRAAAMVERYFATLQGRPPPRRPDLPAVTRKGETRVDIAADVGADEVWMTWVTPPFGAPGDAALDRVAALLGHGDASRLQQRIVGSGLARWVDAGQRSMSLASVFMIHAIAAPGAHAEDIVAAVDRELTDLGAFGPTTKEMKRAQSYWATGDMFELETAMGRAWRLTEASHLGRLRAPFDWASQEAKALVAEDVRAAAAGFLSPKARAAVVVTRFRQDAPLSGVVVKRDEP